MSRRLIAGLALICALALGVGMLTNPAFRRRQIMRKVSERVEGIDRFVDVRVDLNVVVGDPNGEELVEGKPPLRIVRTHHFGGVIDTRSSPSRLRIDVPVEGRPRQWYCSEDQEQVVLHPDTEPLGQLVYGSEGAGKTVALLQWTYLRWLDHIGERREGGITAPIEERAKTIRTELAQLFRGWYRTSKSVITLCDGTRLRLVSTHRQSAAQGSRIQGFNWSWCARDEAQDQLDVHEDIESRGRAAKHGRYKQLLTATAKDDPHWRTLRDQLDAARTPDGAKLWSRRTLYGRRSPFVPESFWVAKEATMSPREFARRVEAMDVPPERATYPNWSREKNLITVPSSSEMGHILGWVDVTKHELRAYGPDLRLLVGHDPGALWHVSLFLQAFIEQRHYQAYLADKRRPFWVVMGELNTEQSTTEVHIERLLDVVRRRWMINMHANGTNRTPPDAPQMLVRADPADMTERVNTETHKSVYTLFANAGIRIKPAAYNATNDGHGKVPRDPGIEVVNTLFCAASKERRLLVARNPDGSPAAEKLVAAIESSERDLAGKAETQRKGAADISHWPAALRYAVWAIERPRLKLISQAGAP